MGSPANITPYHEGGTTGDLYGWNKRGANGTNNHIGYWYDGTDRNSTNDNKWYVRTLEEELTALGKLPLRYTSDNSVIGLATYESVEPVIGFDKVINASGLASFQNTTYEPVVPKAGTFFKLKKEVSGNYMTATNGTAEGSVKVKTTPTV